jgi:hypothetical protein
MAENRPGKPTDQEETERAYQILLKTMQDNPDIEQTLWSGACWSALVNGHINSGITYEEFCKEMESVRQFFKYKWRAL